MTNFKKTFAWFIFFLLCMAVGYFQGVSPDRLSKNSLSTARKFQVLVTDDSFLPDDLRLRIERELNLQISVSIIKDWPNLLTATIESPAADLLIIPRHWALSLTQQNLLVDLGTLNADLENLLYPDFRSTQKGFYFFPIYWLKTFIQVDGGQSFDHFLSNKNLTTLFLLADEDLILKHFENWKRQGVLSLVQTKKILTLPLDQLQRSIPEGAAAELPLRKPEDTEDETSLGSLSVWGATIPTNSSQQITAMKVLEILSQRKNQEDHLLQTAFNSALNSTQGNSIPPVRRADFIRELKLKNTIILDSKRPDAKEFLQREFGFTL